MGRDEVGTWYRAGMLFLSVICGSIVSMWINSMDAQSTTQSMLTSPNTVSASQTIRPATGLVSPATGVIGVDVDRRRLEYIRMTN